VGWKCHSVGELDQVQKPGLQENGGELGSGVGWVRASIKARMVECHANNYCLLTSEDRSCSG